MFGTEKVMKRGIHWSCRNSFLGVYKQFFLSNALIKVVRGHDDLSAITRNFLEMTYKSVFLKLVSYLDFKGQEKLICDASNTIVRIMHQ